MQLKQAETSAITHLFIFFIAQTHSPLLQPSASSHSLAATDPPIDAAFAIFSNKALPINAIYGDSCFMDCLGKKIREKRSGASAWLAIKSDRDGT